MKKILIIVLSIFIISGCTSYKELSDIAIVTTMALTKENNNYKIIVQVLDTKKSTTDTINPSVVLYESKGITIHEAFRNISLESSKNLYTGHLTTVIVSDSIFKNDTDNFIDFIERNNEIDKNFDLLITTNNIKDIMEIIPPLESIPSEKISKSIEIASKFQGMIDIVKFDNFLENIYTTGIDPVLPIIYIKEVDSNNKDINPDKRLLLKKELAIFKDNKFINYLSVDASLGFNILNKSDTSSIITFNCKNSYASVTLNNVIPTINYNINTKKLDISLDIDAIFNEINCNLDIKNDRNILIDMFNERIKNIVLSTIKEEKENNSDFLGIENNIYKNNYEFYKNNNIDNIIKNLDTNITINSNFNRNINYKGSEKY